MWRTLSTPDGRRVVGDAIAAELEAQVAEAFKYDADDPRFDAEAAAALEKEARDIRAAPLWPQSARRRPTATGARTSRPKTSRTPSVP